MLARAKDISIPVSSRNPDGRAPLRTSIKTPEVMSSKVATLRAVANALMNIIKYDPLTKQFGIRLSQFPLEGDASSSADEACQAQHRGRREANGGPHGGA